MKLFYLISLAILLLSASSAADEEKKVTQSLSMSALSNCGNMLQKKPVTKLQIGVKKRVENCQIKSRRGDSLKMHYTVLLNPYSTTERRN